MRLLLLTLALAGVFISPTRSDGQNNEITKLERLNQTTQDWHRGALFETTVLRVSLWFRHRQKAAKVTKFVTRRFLPSSSELTGCHRSVRMSCGLI